MTRQGARDVWAYLALLAVLASAVLLFTGLGDTAFSDRDEGEYAASVAAMERTGDYVVPTLNGRTYLEKPILIFWAVAGAGKVFPDAEFAARLPSALSALALVIITAILAWRFSGSLAWAGLSAAALGFTPLFLLVGRACLTDMLLTLFTTGSLYCFFWATERENPLDRPWYLAGWAALGLAFLTKGPVGPAVVLPTAFLYAIIQGRLWTTLKRAQIHWGVLIFVLINLPWFGLVFYRLGTQFWQDFFVSQNIRRFSEVLLGHGGGLVYYLPVLLAGMFPFFPAALAGLGLSLAKNPKALREAYPAARLRMLAAVAALVTFVVFSVAATKQINYILPAFPFLALLAGHFLWSLAMGEKPGRWTGLTAKWVLWLSGAIMVVVMLALVLGLPFLWNTILGSIRPDSSEYALPQQAPVFILWPLAGLIALAVCLGGFWWAGRAGKPKLVGWFLAGGGALFCAVLFLGLIPSVDKVMNEPAKTLALEAAKASGGKAQMVSFGLWKPSQIYYSGGELPRIRGNEPQKLAEVLAGGKPVLVFSRVKLETELAKVEGFVRLAAKGGYLVGGNEAGATLWEIQAKDRPESLLK